MKKSLITLAVAATAVAPMAASAAMLQAAGDQDGINLYGSVRPQVVSDGNTNFSDGGSRWGVKGSHDLGNGLSAIYRIERGFSTATRSEDSNTVNRLGYAGLSGGFGTIIMGNQWTPYYNVIGSPSDVFASTGVQNYAGPFRSNDSALAYALPKMDVLSGAVAFIANAGVDDAGEDIDAVSAAINAAFGPMNIGLGYNKVETDDDALLGMSIGGNFGGFGATFMVEDDGINNPWAITGTFAGFALQFSDADLVEDSTATTLGYTYKLSGNTRVQLAYESNDRVDDDKFVARYRVDF